MVSGTKTSAFQGQLNKAVCPIAKRYDAPALGIVEHGDDAQESSNAMGFALNGVAFQARSPAPRPSSSRDKYPHQVASAPSSLLPAPCSVCQSDPRGPRKSAGTQTQAASLSRILSLLPLCAASLIDWRCLKSLRRQVFPLTVTNEQPLDLCLGHNQQGSENGVQPSGMYHYHEVSPCLNANFLTGKVMSDCASNDSCRRDIVQWALSSFEDAKTKTVIGIAKNGHVLYGPYDGSGRLWQTSAVDACNGAWSSDLSDYFYVGTRWHPYLVGCMGPANSPHGFTPPLYANCSRNNMEQYVGVIAPSPTPPSASPPARSCDVPLAELGREADAQFCARCEQCSSYCPRCV